MARAQAEKLVLVNAFQEEAIWFMSRLGARICVGTPAESCPMCVTPDTLCLQLESIRERKTQYPWPMPTEILRFLQTRRIAGQFSVFPVFWHVDTLFNLPWNILKNETRVTTLNHRYSQQTLACLPRVLKWLPRYQQMVISSRWRSVLALPEIQL